MWHGILVPDQRIQPLPLLCWVLTTVSPRQSLSTTFWAWSLSQMQKSGVLLPCWEPSGTTHYQWPLLQGIHASHTSHANTSAWSEIPVCVPSSHLTAMTCFSAGVMTQPPDTAVLGTGRAGLSLGLFSHPLPRQSWPPFKLCFILCFYSFIELSPALDWGWLCSNFFFTCKMSVSTLTMQMIHR